MKEEKTVCIQNVKIKCKYFIVNLKLLQITYMLTVWSLQVSDLFNYPVEHYL